MNEKTLGLTKAAVIGGLYAMLTLLGAVFGISYSGVQFRFSEALCILPAFTSAAVPGLAAGCFAANILSSVSPLDAVFGTLATLLAALCTRALRNVRIKGYPFCSLLMPVVFNGCIIGAEIAFFSSADSFLTAFTVNSATVAAGEAAVMFTLGSFLFYAVEKNERLKKIISGIGTR